MNPKALAICSVFAVCIAAVTCAGFVSDCSDAESYTLTWRYAPMEDKSLDVNVGDTVTLNFFTTGYNNTSTRYAVQDKPSWLAQSGSENAPVLSGTATTPGTYHANVTWMRVDSGVVGATQNIHVTINVIAPYSDHTIVYDGNGNTGGSTVSTVVTDQNTGSSVITLASNGFTKTGYRFTGWLVNGTVLQPGQTVSVGAGATVTAKAQWEANELTVAAGNLSALSGMSYSHQIGASTNNGGTISYQITACTGGAASVSSAGVVTYHAPEVSSTAFYDMTVRVTASFSDGSSVSKDVSFTVTVDPVLSFTNAATSGTLSVKGA